MLLSLVKLRGLVGLGAWLCMSLSTAPQALAQAAGEGGLSVILDEGDSDRGEVAASLGVVTIPYDDELAIQDLAKFSAVMLAVENVAFTREFDRALQKYVASGGRLVLVHAAGDCFFREMSYQQLAGGAFASFSSKLKPVDLELTKEGEAHPWFKGIDLSGLKEPSYGHEELHASCKVLATRDGEPFIWIRPFSKGEVIYLGFGGSEETWKSPQWKTLVAKLSE